METGFIAETKVNKTRQLQLSTWVFATANACENIVQPLLSRFVVLEIPQYSFEEFKEIVVYRLKRENVVESTAISIAEGFGGIVDIQVSPDGNLYVLSLYHGGDDCVNQRNENCYYSLRTPGTIFKITSIGNKN